MCAALPLLDARLIFYAITPPCRAVDAAYAAALIFAATAALDAAAAPLPFFTR